MSSTHPTQTHETARAAGPAAAQAEHARIIANQAELRRLLAAKARFLVPAGLFFVLYYFSLPILVGWAPALMKQRVMGPVNLAYLFALSQFLMAWTIAFLYVRQASRWDRMAKAILDRECVTVGAATA